MKTTLVTLAQHSSCPHLSDIEIYGLHDHDMIPPQIASSRMMLTFLNLENNRHLMIIQSFEFAKILKIQISPPYIKNVSVSIVDISLFGTDPQKQRRLQNQDDL